ncbi:3-oxoacyl-ACP reductase FabG [Porticoccus sp. W117]|uniref:3-oxoacyl-ACP reductase FabG n=1 Tax=Porticoccus sp. W117 TaxID=3054777 RepID=UPI002593B627|nr:3-oxoacyl-ACP reductase FabG [Porticoccus sp. W117]MDM3872139.1 3-oxoacyl-ACP reductase FabG [Porticoccus sp. W117]
MSEQILQGKVALVTGASRGIGAAIADELASKGATVIGTATSEGGAQRIGERLADKGGQGMVLNVTDQESVDGLLKAINEQHGAPTILVNNAGITKDNILMRMKDDEWFDVIDTNLSSIYRLSKASVRGMTKARWGRIINITSVIGSMGNVGQSNYAATKAGAAGMARALAKELGSRNITVNSVAPGFIQTDMTDELGDDAKSSLLSMVPLARLGQPQEIAQVVSFLASDAAAYITGETIHVNGGMYMG